MKNIRLDGETVYLRSITSEDTPLVVKWRNQENVIKYFIYRGEFTEETHTNWLKTKVETGLVDQFIVCLKDGDVPIGSTYLRDIDTKNSKAEYGVFIGEEGTRGQGIGKEILNLTVKYAFENLKLHKVYARVIDTNKASLYCFLHSGFFEEAFFKESVLLDGQYRNVIILSRFNPDEGDGFFENKEYKKEILGGMRMPMPGKE